MKKILLLAGLAFGAYVLLKPKKDAGDTLLSSETGFRELTDAEAQNYIDQNVDLKAAFGTDLQKAKEHWRNWGWEKEFSIGGRPNPYLA